MKRSILLTVMVVMLLSPPFVFGQEHASSNQANEANNPLTPKITVNFHDQYAPELYDSDADTNAFLLRGLIPHKLGGAAQLFRYTLPIMTVPTASGDTTGLGDLNVIDLFPFKAGGIEIGVGPQFTFPTASEDETGTGKYQAGIATIVIAPRHFGLIGGLITWQASFEGDDDRADQDNLAVQPFFIYNLSKGWYLRSTATMSWDLERNTHVIPIGTGAGKVFVRASGTTINVFAEPQWTVDHKGAGQPKYQIFAGVTLQFPIRKR